MANHVLQLDVNDSGGGTALIADVGAAASEVWVTFMAAFNEALLEFLATYGFGTSLVEVYDAAECLDFFIGPNGGLADWYWFFTDLCGSAFTDGTVAQSFTAMQWYCVELHF